ncbi:hypothetical protein [Cellulomonas dongxiuzhuiae]|nr:hypothetical protein [Cellulomonas dongxiuzhuiae]
MSGSVFALVPWAGRRTRFVVGGVVALAWIAYTTWMKLALT